MKVVRKSSVLAKKLLPFSLFIMLFSCNGGGSEYTNNTGTTNITNSNKDLLVWEPSSFPLSLEVESSFSHDEATQINSMVSKWNAESPASTNLFAINSLSGNDSGKTKVDDYYDGKLGIYTVGNEISDMPSGALAITTISGVQKTDYIKIIHADILVNTGDWSFTTDENDNTKYDLPSVILHELGHFAGLSHTLDSKEESVMQPSISKSQVNRDLFQYDIDNIRSHYDIFFGSTSALMADVGDGVQVSEAIVAEEDRLSIVLELRPDGLCNHYTNGKKTHSHKIDLKKR